MNQHTVCSRKNGFSIKCFFREFSRFLDACSISQKWVFFWASRLNTKNRLIFARDFLPLFLSKMLLKHRLFSRILDACSNSQKWVFEEMGFSECLLRTKARKMVNHFCENILYCVFGVIERPRLEHCLHFFRTGSSSENPSSISPNKAFWQWSLIFIP